MQAVRCSIAMCSRVCVFIGNVAIKRWTGRRNQDHFVTDFTHLCTSIVLSEHRYEVWKICP